MTRLLAALLMMGTAVAHAQQIGQNVQRDASGTFTMSIKSQLVVETVVVRDKNGKPIEGLTAKDFMVTEDGEPQSLRICEYQSLPSGPSDVPLKEPSKEDVQIYNRLALSQISAEKPQTVKYKDRRLIALYFDMTAMPPNDQLRALTAAEKFVRTQMTEADLIAVMRYSGGAVNVLQDFTADRTRLLSILQTLVVGEGQGLDETSSDATAEDKGAAFGQDDSEFNIFNTDRQLSALQTAAKMLGTLSEKKQLIYFASGLRLNGIDNQAQLHATVDAAVRSGVSFWPVDARGLVASAPLGDATQGSPGNAGMYNGTAAQAGATRFQQSQDTLYALAGDTGGKALFDNNDLTRGITQAQQAVTSYYVLGYYTTNTAQNGHFRKVKVTLNNNAQAKLEYKQGYYANKVFAKFNATEKERQLEDALMLEDPVTELTIAMELNYFQLNRAEYFVPIVVKIPGRELALAKRGGAQHTLIDFVGEIKDDYAGTTVTNLRDNVNIKLTDATAQQLAKVPVEYDAGFTLLPGKYTIKLLARDDETGRIGTFQTKFVIPNLNKEDKRVPISTVVLSAQRTSLKDTVYDAVKDKEKAKQAAQNPLVENGMKTVPSVTRVFSNSRDLYVYLQGYEQEVVAAQPLVAFVSFYRGDTKVMETQPMEMSQAVGSRLKVLPLRFDIAVNTLPPGQYDCQVTVLNPADGKSTFWRAPVTVMP